MLMRQVQPELPIVALANGQQFLQDWPVRRLTMAGRIDIDDFGGDLVAGGRTGRPRQLRRGLHLRVPGRLEFRAPALHPLPSGDDVAQTQTEALGNPGQSAEGAPGGRTSLAASWPSMSSDPDVTGLGMPSRPSRPLAGGW